MIVDASTRLRVVIVNYNGGTLLKRAVDSVQASRWPGSLQIVVVDNASTDGSLDGLNDRAGVAVIKRDVNEGFGANNHGFADLLDQDLAVDFEPADCVALLNPDAMVRSNSLVLLAGALDATRRIGAASPKILFDRPYVQLDVSSGALTVSKIQVGGVDVTSQCHQVGSGYRLPGADGPIWCCVAGSALRVPSRRFGESVEITCAKGSAGVLSGNRVNGACVVNISSAVLQTMNIVQNAGSELDARLNGRNRGFGDVDRSRSYSKRPPAWCGAAVMLHAEYLADIGGFEPEYFLYYEDVDMSLRGIARGWSTTFVPDAVVEHRHSEQATQGTQLVEVLQHRNRLLMLARNAPLSMAALGLGRAMLTPASLVVGAIRSPRRARSRLRLARWRLQSVLGAIKRIPWAVRSRRQVGRKRRIPAKRVFREAVSKRSSARRGGSATEQRG